MQLQQCLFFHTHHVTHSHLVLQSGAGGRAVLSRPGHHARSAVGSAPCVGTVFTSNAVAVPALSADDKADRLYQTDPASPKTPTPTSGHHESAALTQGAGGRKLQSAQGGIPCVARDSFMGLNFHDATVVHSNLGGLGGQCGIKVFDCDENEVTDSVRTRACMPTVRSRPQTRRHGPPPTRQYLAPPGRWSRFDFRRGGVRLFGSCETPAALRGCVARPRPPSSSLQPRRRWSARMQNKRHPRAPKQTITKPTRQVRQWTGVKTC